MMMKRLCRRTFLDDGTEHEESRDPAGWKRHGESDTERRGKGSGGELRFVCAEKRWCERFGTSPLPLPNG